MKYTNKKFTQCTTDRLKLMKEKIFLNLEKKLENMFAVTDTSVSGTSTVKYGAPDSRFGATSAGVLASLGKIEDDDV